MIQNAPSNVSKTQPEKTHVAAQWKCNSPLICCRFDPTGRFVFAGAEDCTIQRWELGSGENTGDKDAKNAEVKSTAFVGHESWPRCLAFTQDGQWMISGGCDDSLIWWKTDAETPKAEKTIAAHDGWIRALAVSPDGKLLASAGNDKLVKLWQIETGEPVGVFEGHERDVYSLAFHPGGASLLSGDLMGQVKQWNLSTGKLTRSFDAKALHTYNGGQRVDYGGVRSIDFSGDLKHLACAGLHKATNPLGAVNEPLVVRFDWESQKVIRSHTAAGVRGVAWRAMFHPDGFLFGASGGAGGGFLLFWKAEEDKEFFKFKLPNTARDLDLHPDGLQIATAHHDRHLRISKMVEKPK